MGLGQHSPRASVDLASFIILTGRKRMPGPLSRIIDFVMPAFAREGRGGVEESARLSGPGRGAKAVQVEGRRRCR